MHKYEVTLLKPAAEETHVKVTIETDDRALGLSLVDLITTFSDWLRSGKITKQDLKDISTDA